MSSLICTVYHVVYAPAGVVDLLACLHEQTNLMGDLNSVQTRNEQLFSLIT